MLMLVAVSLMAGSAMAGTVDVFGYSWETTEATYELGLNPEILYVVNNPDSITVTDIWAGWASITTPLSIGAGDVMSYDRYLTNEWRNRVGLDWALSTWLEAYHSLPLDAAYANYDTWFEFADNNRETWAFTTATGWFELAASGSPTALASTGIHYEISFDSASYSLTMTDIVTGAQIASATAALDPAAIGYWTFGLWNTEQDMTIENFVIIYRRANRPTPANGATLVPTDQVLSWAAPNEPNVVSVASYDVYLDPNLADVTAGDASIKTTEASASHTPAADLKFGTTYYWRVDSNVNYDFNPGGEPNMVAGGIWSFTVVGAAPLIESFDNVLTSLDLLDADLAAVVGDADFNMASVSWEVVTDDYRYPAGAVASVTDTTSDLYAPTATFTTDTVGTYIVKLTATDGDAGTAEAMAEVRVLETACDAAQASGNWAGFDPLDSDTDCDVDIVDFAALAAKWLSDIALDGLETWVGAVAYLPGYGIPNGGFELGTLGYWKSETWASGEITDVPADVQEGTYACALLKSNDGVTTGALDLPVGSHSVTLWYKGDIPVLVCGFDNTTTAAYTITSPADGTTLVTGAVPDYTQFTVEFEVTVAGIGYFWAWGDGTGVGTGFVDDVRLNLN